MSAQMREHRPQVNKAVFLSSAQSLMVALEARDSNAKQRVSLCLTIGEGRNKLRGCEKARCKLRKSIYLAVVRGMAAWNTASARTAEET
jgi:hypothetical protein